MCHFVRQDVWELRARLIEIGRRLCPGSTVTMVNLVEVDEMRKAMVLPSHAPHFQAAVPQPPPGGGGGSAGPGAARQGGAWVVRGEPSLAGLTIQHVYGDGASASWFDLPLGCCSRLCPFTSFCT